MFLIPFLSLIMQLFLSFFFINFGYTYILTSINRTTMFWEILITLLLPLVILLGISLGFVISNSFWALLYILMSFVTLAILLLNIGIEFITFFYIIVYLGALMMLFLFVIMLFNLHALSQNSDKKFGIFKIIIVYFLSHIIAILTIENMELINISPLYSLSTSTFFDYNVLYFLNLHFWNSAFIFKTLYTDNVIFFILLTLILLYALIGALTVISIVDKDYKYISNNNVYKKSILLFIYDRNSFWALLYILMSFVILTVLLLNSVIGFITFFYVTNYIASLIILFHFIIMIWINFNYFFYIIFFSKIFLYTSTFIAPSHSISFSSNNFKICPIRKDLLNIIIFSPYVLNYYILLLFFCLIFLILYYIYNKDNFNFWFLFFYDFYKNDVWLYDRDLFNWSINLQIMLFYIISFHFPKVLDNINIEDPSALKLFLLSYISSFIFHILITIKITRFIYKLFNFSNHLENIIFEMWKNKIENIDIDNKSFSVQELMNILKNYNEICFILVLLWTLPLYFSSAIVFIWFFYSLIIIFITLCSLFGAANVIAFFYLFVFLIYKCISLFFFKK